MKRLLSLTLSALLVSSPLTAQTLASGANEVEMVQSRLKIKEIKQLVGTQIPNNETCLDEFLSRREELSKKLWLSPLSGAAEIGGGTGIGLIVGAAIGTTLIKDGGWAQLGALLGGGLIGFAAGATVFISGTTVNIVKFANNDRLIKWIAEARLSASGKASEKMHQKYSKKYKRDNAAEEDLTQILVQLDQSGQLCNGDIVAPRRFKKGKKLKQRLANKTEIFKKMHEVISQ
ncbi:MAG: hypothetical protein ACOVP4_05185 [Bacteriovoracaceae bacterium]